MTTLLTIVSAVLVSAVPVAQEPPGDIPWATSLDAAREKASAVGKPVLLLDLFGRLDEELC